MTCVVFLVGVNDLGRALLEVEPSGPFFHARMKIKPWLLTSNLSNLVSATVQSVHHRRDGPRTDVEDPSGQNYVHRRRKRSQAEKSRSMPDLQRALALFEARLEEIVVECRSRGLRFVFCTQPVLGDEALADGEIDLLWMGALKDGTFLHHGELRRGLELYNERLESFAARRGVIAVDLGVMSGDARFFYDDCHFNEAGASEAARRIAAGMTALRE
jgi:hypothetical protein